MSVELPDAFLQALANEVAPLVARLITSRSAPEYEPWIGVEEAAEHLACKRQRIYDLVSQRSSNGFPVRKEGSRLLFKRSALDKWLERGGASCPR